MYFIILKLKYNFFFFFLNVSTFMSQILFSVKQKELILIILSRHF